MSAAQTKPWMRAVILLVTVLAFVFAFPPFDAAELVYVMAVPMLTWGYYCHSCKRIFWMSLGAGVLCWIGLLSWLWHLSIFAMLGLGVVCGLFMSAWFYIAIYGLKRFMRGNMLVRIVGVLSLAAVWVLLEWLRGWVFTGFPWLPLSASMWVRPPILQVIEYTGSAGLSFAIIFFNLAIAVTVLGLMHRMQNLGKDEERMPVAFELYLGSILFMGFLGLHAMKFPKPQDQREMFTVGMVQPHVSSALKWEPEKIFGNIKVLEEETLALKEQSPDLILWPETAITAALNDNLSMRTWVERLSVQMQTPIISGALSREDNKYYNAAFQVTPQVGLLQKYYQKRKAVPFGEYVPLRKFLPFVNKVVPVEFDVNPGQSAEPMLVQLGDKVWQAGCLICYEDIFSNLVRDTVEAGADFLLVLTNSGWYGEGGMPMQHAANSALRAVEYRRPVVRCGNFGWSGWIDEYGEVQGAMDDIGSVHYRGGKIFTVSRDASFVGVQTFYARHGDWFVYVSMGLVLIGVFLYRRNELHV